MNEGAIQGGWEYIAAAYGFIYFALVAYTVILLLRSSGNEE
jgi:hypothetical protein